MSSSSASASASVADPSLLLGDYEVFLNFCGEDTRLGFTDCLYTFLNSAGIRTFRDNEDLHVGKEIGQELLKAIEDSKISIPIFSKNYASKKWCLLELAHMVKCLKNGTQMILPIFYDVDPDDVQHQRGSYEEAFRQHRGKRHYDEKVIQEWENALKIVGQLKGLELKKETGGREGELVEIIRNNVLQILKQNNKLEDLDFVGKRSRIEEMEELLNIDSDGVRFIGIHGMGGLGKTTIAEVIYYKYQHQFECHSFLKDVRETESRNGILHLQKKLLLDIRKTKSDIDDSDDGIIKIKDAVRRKNVLIVLDDVDKESQVDKLAGSWKWFGARARIIITTRNEEVLHALKRTCHDHPEVYGSYQPSYLDADESLELFSKYAFVSKSPQEGYDTLSKKVASTAAGLPLVLKVTGSLLYGETDKELWEEKIKELDKIPPAEVQQILRLSFDPLTWEQKEIFLDIACLFIGQDKINPCYMWDDCGFYPRNVLKVLERRSLITVEYHKPGMPPILGRYDIIRMHDQLRDLGRQIACEGKLNELGRWSRLWDCDKAFEVYRTGQGTENVKALCLGGNSIYPRRRLEGEKFVGLQNLRYLTLDAWDNLYGDFEHRLPNLRWLQWRDSWLKFTVTNLHLRNLVILDLSSSYIREDTNLWSHIQMSKLKVLDLSKCKYLRRVPFLSTFSNLERLDVSHCYKLCSLDGIEELESLRYLDASYCRLLETMPNLSSLTELKELKVRSCERLDVVVEKFLDRLPDLSNLKRLDAFGVTVSEIRGLGGLKSLEHLYVKNCTHIERVFGLMNLKRLTMLTIQFCPELIEIHGLEGLESLEFLEVKDCESIVTLSDLSKLKRLLLLDVHDCSALIEIDGLCGLMNLKRLIIESCPKLIEIHGLEGLESLEFLDVSDCRSIVTLPDLSKLKRLNGSDVHDCSALIEIDGLHKLESFEYLQIRGCASIEKFPNLQNSGMIKELDLSGCTNLHEVERLQLIESLESLDMYGCKALEIIDLRNLKNLKKLNISFLPRLNEILGLEELESLELLYMVGCESIEMLPGISKLTKLVVLNAGGCVKLTEIRGLEELKSLKYLNIGFCKSIKNLPDFSNLKKLEVINAAGCEGLTEIRGLENLESFRNLFIYQCESLNTLMYSQVSRIRIYRNISFNKYCDPFCIKDDEYYAFLDYLNESSWYNLHDAFGYLQIVQQLTFF